MANKTYNTVTHESSRRTYTLAVAPVDWRRQQEANRAALRLARRNWIGWEHYGESVCYLVDSTGITRIETSSDGRRLSERKLS